MPALAVLALTSVDAAAQTAATGRIVSAPTRELNWVELPNAGGVKYANLGHLFL